MFALLDIYEYCRYMEDLLFRLQRTNPVRAAILYKRVSHLWNLCDIPW